MASPHQPRSVPSESRRGVRYPVELECTVSGLSKPAALKGRTVNMSRCGVLVSFDRAGPPPMDLRTGRAVKVILELPKAPYFRGCWLQCNCRTTRVQELPDGLMAAFEVKRYHFRPPPEA